MWFSATFFLDENNRAFSGRSTVIASGIFDPDAEEPKDTLRPTRSAG